MPGLDSSMGVDIVSDLNGQSADAVPYHGSDLPPEQIDRASSPAPDAPAPEAPEAPPKSLRDTLSDAFKGGEAPKANPTPDGAEIQPEGPSGGTPNPADAPPLVKVGNRWHNPDGTFASQEAIDAMLASQNTGEQGQQQEQQLVALNAPWANRLTAIEREQIAALPAETRQFVERTMEAVEQRSQLYSEYDQLEQLIGPRREAWAQQGSNTFAAINQLFSLSDFAGRNPGEFVMWFADQHKLDLDTLLDERDALQQQVPVDPRLNGLQQEIVQLKTLLTGQLTQQQQQQQAANLREVQQFMDAKDATGKSLRPYFSEVVPELQRHIAVIKQQQPWLSGQEVLQAAYDFACYTNVAVRERMQQEQQRALRDKAVAEAARARAAAKSISGGPVSGDSKAPNNANRSLRDEIQAAFAASQ